MAEWMLAQTTLDEILEGLASDAPSPGSGAAAAAALALGIGCLCKAVSISRKSRDFDQSLLQEADERLRTLLGQAVMAADADAHGFPRLLASQPDDTCSASQHVADDLVALSERIVALCEQACREVEHLARHIKPSMANDLLAARLLSEAACEIVRANGAENKKTAAEPAAK